MTFWSLQEVAGKGFEIGEKDEEGKFEEEIGEGNEFDWEGWLVV